MISAAAMPQLIPEKEVFGMHKLKKLTGVILLVVALAGVLSGCGSDKKADPQLAPAAPTGLLLSGVTATGMTLTWNDVANETGYRVYRKANFCGNAGTFASVAELPAGTTAYTDAPLTPNTYYLYQVVAYNAAGESGYDTQAGDYTTPPAPVLALVGTNGLQVTLSWTYPWLSCISAYPSEGYLIEEATAADFSSPTELPESTCNTGVGDTVSPKEVTFTKSSAGTYYYRVTACDREVLSTGRSLASNSVVAAVTALAAPTNALVSSVTDQQSP
jgi:hypothetical protein